MYILFLLIIMGFSAYTNYKYQKKNYQDNVTFRTEVLYCLRLIIHNLPINVEVCSDDFVEEELDELHI